MARTTPGRRPLGPRALIGRTVRYNALRKGLLGGSGPWFAMFVLLRLGRWFGKVTKRGDAPVVFESKLPAGVGIELRNHGPAARPSRRRANADG